jgi:site-specific DNA-methyltransferase (adenine-specific)
MYSILNQDCLEGLSQMGDGIADIALIDPPYFDYKTGHRKDKGGKLSQSLVQQTREDQLRTVQECIRVLKDGSSFWFFTNWQEAWWFQERFHTFLRNEIVWNKGNWAAGDLEGSFGCMWEAVFLGTKGKGWKYQGKRLNDVNDWVIPRVGTNRIHATEKPVDLYRKIIEISTVPEALVIDPYVGSGASCEASLSLGRHFLGYEIDKEYCNIAKGRIETWLQKQKS